MKNSQNGFATILVVVIVAIIAIGGGAYVYTQQKAAAELGDSASQTNTEINTQTNTQKATTTPKNTQKPIAATTGTLSGDITFASDCGEYSSYCALTHISSLEIEIVQYKTEGERLLETKIIKTVKINSDGTYHTALSPGTYSLHPKGEGDWIRGLIFSPAPSSEFVIKAGTNTTVDIIVNTMKPTN